MESDDALREVILTIANAIRLSRTSVFRRCGNEWRHRVRTMSHDALIHEFEFLLWQSGFPRIVTFFNTGVFNGARAIIIALGEFIIRMGAETMPLLEPVMQQYEEMSCKYKILYIVFYEKSV